MKFPKIINDIEYYLATYEIHTSLSGNITVNEESFRNIFEFMKICLYNASIWQLLCIKISFPST